MSTLIPGNNALLPSRIKKTPRKLSYNKCRFCRDPKVKTKCVWNRGSWPNKCHRCSEKALPCSEPRNKAEEHYSNAKKPPVIFHASSNFIDTKSGSKSVQVALKRPKLPLSGVLCQHDEPGSFYKATSLCPQSNINPNEGLVYENLLSTYNQHQLTARRLQLLPLHGMILMALEEIKFFTRELLRPMLDTPDMYNCYAAAVNDLYCKYEQSSSKVGRAINGLAPHSKLAVEAALDLRNYSKLKRPPRMATILEKRQYASDVEKTKKKYSAQEHLGMFIVLTMYQSTFGDFFTPTENSSIDDYLSSINTFLDKCIMTFTGLGQSIEMLRAHGWFFPTRMIRIPSIRSYVREKGLKDFMGRSVSLIEYDAGIPVHEIDVFHDPPDYMGRTLLYVSCIRNDTYAVTLISGRLIRNTRSKSGLPPLHVAAMIGNLEIFKKLHDYYRHVGCLESVLMEPDASGRTILQLAGCLNDQILGFYLSFHMFKMEQSERSNTGSRACYFVDRSGKIRYEAETIVSAFRDALLHDREEVVRLLTAHFDPFIWDSHHRTPLWYASYYGRLYAIPLLFGSDSINVADRQGRTPLMVAAIQGFEKILCLLFVQDGLLMKDAERSAQPRNVLDIWLSDKENKTAKDLAVEGGHHECARILGENLYIYDFLGSVRDDERSFLRFFNL